MKPIYLLFLMLLAATNSYTQDIPIGDYKKLQIGINFSPDIAYRTLKDRGGNGHKKDENERSRLAMTFGINACYNFKCEMKFKIGIETGMQYSIKGYQNIKQLGGLPRDSSLPITLAYTNNFHYIDIPLKINISLGAGKVRFFCSAGLVANMFIRETITREADFEDHIDMTHTKAPSSDTKKISLSAICSMGIDWQWNRGLSLRIEPTYRLGLTPFNDAIIGTYFHSAGLNLGFYCGF